MPPQGELYGGQAPGTQGPPRTAQAVATDLRGVLDHNQHDRITDHRELLQEAAGILAESQRAVEAAVDTFERDLGFTAPELFPMRMQQLRERIRDAFEGEG